MIPYLDDNQSLYYLLEPGEVMEKGDEYYSTLSNTWLPISDGEPQVQEDTGETYWPEAMIGYEYDPEENKSVRRKDAKL